MRDEQIGHLTLLLAYGRDCARQPGLRRGRKVERQGRQGSLLDELLSELNGWPNAWLKRRGSRHPVLERGCSAVPGQLPSHQRRRPPSYCAVPVASAADRNGKAASRSEKIIKVPAAMPCRTAGAWETPRTAPYPSITNESACPASPYSCGTANMSLRLRVICLPVRPTCTLTGVQFTRVTVNPSSDPRLSEGTSMCWGPLSSTVFARYCFLLDLLRGRTPFPESSAHAWNMPLAPCSNRGGSDAILSKASLMRSGPGSVETRLSSDSLACYHHQEDVTGSVKRG
nr:hypothetical protein CFP56_02844 [Quercus suber]